MQQKRVSGKELIAVFIITLLMAFMEITGLPSKLFVTLHIADIDPVYFALMTNFAIAGLLCFLLLRLFCPRWQLNLHAQGFFSGIKQYGLACLLAALITFGALFVGLRPFDATPTWGKAMSQTTFNKEIETAYPEIERSLDSKTRRKIWVGIRLDR